MFAAYIAIKTANLEVVGAYEVYSGELAILVNSKSNAT